MSFWGWENCHAGLVTWVSFYSSLTLGGEFTHIGNILSIKWATFPWELKMFWPRLDYISCYAHRPVVKGRAWNWSGVMWVWVWALRFWDVSVYERTFVACVHVCILACLCVCVCAHSCMCAYVCVSCSNIQTYIYKTCSDFRWKVNCRLQVSFTVNV
jgi:hypothetical protein